jgi:C4-dicarboxylate transporter DctM subunit
MILFIGLCFTLLLFSGVPIAVILGVTTLMSLVFFSTTPLTIITQQLFNALDQFVLLAIPFFILAGAIMTRGGIARRLINFVNALVGWFPGGLAMAGILGCIFFAAISGSSPATVVAIGAIMIPALIKAGYGEKFSLGLITVSGSLGIVIPPSHDSLLPGHERVRGGNFYGRGDAGAAHWVLVDGVHLFCGQKTQLAH